MSNINIGVDIGKMGAIVIQTSNTSTIDTYVMPMIKSELDYRELYNVLNTYCGATEDQSHIHVVFEKLGVIFGTSKATAFSMGHQAGAVEMCCVALGLPFTKVPPKIWQKSLFVGITEISRKSKSGKTTVRDTKAMALLAAKQLFPRAKLTFGDVATKAHDGLVDALLMSEYSRRHY